MSRPGVSAPSLQVVHFTLGVRSPLLYLYWLIDDVREEFRSVSVTFDYGHFRLFSSTHLGEVDHFKSSLKFDVFFSRDSSRAINSTPSMKLAMAEELAIRFCCSNITKWEHFFRFAISFASSVTSGCSGWNLWIHAWGRLELTSSMTTGRQSSPH